MTMRSALPCSPQQQNGSSLGSGEISIEERTFNRFGPFPNQAYDPPDWVSAKTEALQDFLILVQDVIGDEPNEVFFSAHLWRASALGFRPGMKARGSPRCQPPTRLCQEPHAARGAYLSAATVIYGVRFSLR